MTALKTRCAFDPPSPSISSSSAPARPAAFSPRNLSTAGFDVVVLEQGPYRHAVGVHARRNRRDLPARTPGRRSARSMAQTFREDECEAATYPARPMPAEIRTGRRRQQRAFHRQLLALPRGRFQRSGACSARSPAPLSPTGRSTTPSSSRITRRSTGRSACRARRARSIRRARSPSRCRRCR